MTNSEKFKTADERARAFTKWCEEKQKTAIGKVAKHECSDCPLDEHTPCCFFFWLELEAEEENPMPCPFCGADTEVEIDETGCYSIACIHCEYGSPAYNEEKYAIAAHNRICLAVKEAKEGEVK